MSRIATFAVGTVTSLALVAGSLTAAEAAPLPAQTGVKVAGENTAIDHVRYRRYGYGYGYGYRRGYGGRAAGALVAGTALGLIGGAIAASAAPRYGYGYDYGYAPAYGYGYAPVATYGYGYPAYGYAPAYGYGW